MVLAQSPEPRAQSSVTDLLLEIGTEELPAAYLPGLIEQLGREAGALLQAHHLPYQVIESFGTPRRLLLIVRRLAAQQQKPAEEIRGPSKAASYDGAGKPTQALLGFLRSQRGALAQTKLVSSPKGEYVYLVRPPTTTPTSKVLPKLLPALIGALRAPKTMRWDAAGVRFARPIRWLLALYGAAPIRCAVGRLASGSTTRLGRPQQLREVRVTSIEQYVQLLKRAGVTLDPRERRNGIVQIVAKTAKQWHGAAAPEMVSYGLLDEVTHLAESPVCLAGEFDQRYLALPREVLLASMAKYQRVFAIERHAKPAGEPSTAETILPRFIAILEGAPRRPAAVRSTLERILNARLADSLLFWEADHKHLPLEQMGKNLSGIVFHERLGSMAEKTLRLRALCEPLAEAWQLTEEERQHLRRACQIAKADLVSTMVKEFPTLQGVIGKRYALDSGEPEPVARAIEEQYLPAGDRLPETLIGGGLAIVDKYDTLTSYFGLGLMPTGDQDPFGLRRAAQGIVEAAWKVHRPLPLSPLLRVRGSLPPFRTGPPKDVAAVGHQLQRYLFERLYTFAWPAPVSTDCIDAVLAVPCDDLVDVMDRIASLQRLSGHPSLLKAAKVIERTRNILRSVALRQPDVDPTRFQEPLERQLWEVYRANEERVVGLTQQKSYTEATTLFGELFFEPLHAFFDRVLVNAPEETLQQNRLALMRAIHTLYTERVADLSKLTILQQREESP